MARRLAEGDAGEGRDAHLFTVGISGEIVASRLQLEPDVPDRPASYRLGITMELDLDSLRTQVASCTLLSTRVVFKVNHQSKAKCSLGPTCLCPG